MSIKGQSLTSETGIKGTCESADHAQSPALLPEKPRKSASPPTETSISTKPGVLHWINNLPNPTQQITSTGVSEYPHSLALNPEPPIDTLRHLGSVSPMSSPASSDPSTTDKGKASKAKTGINASDPRFLECCEDRRTYLHDLDSSAQPKRLEDLKQALLKERKGQGADENLAKEYVRTLEYSVNETEFARGVLPILLPMKDVWIDKTFGVAMDLQWSDDVNMGFLSGPRLTTPKPDMTVGYSLTAFDWKTSRRSIQSLGPHARPIPSKPGVVYPTATIEVKRKTGGLEEARLQNLRNGATMIDMFHHLKENSRGEKEIDAAFFDTILALSIQITHNAVEISCYWASQNSEGEVEYNGMVVERWDPNTPKLFIQAHQAIRNGLEWIRKENLSWISKALKTVGAPAVNIRTPSPSEPRELKRPSEALDDARPSKSAKGSDKPVEVEAEAT